MSVLAILGPTGLIATELRETLERRRELWHDLRLLTDDDDEVGTLTEIRGAAAMVSPLEKTSFDDADFAFFIGPSEHYRQYLESLPATTTAIEIASDVGEHGGRPIVDGVNLQHAEGERLLSPHPAVVGLSHLLHPLRPYALTQISATVLGPASVYGKSGLEEMFEQTRALLNFEPVEHQLLPTQAPFNAFDTAEDLEPLRGQLQAVLGDDAPRASIHLLQAGIFHGIGISLHFQLADDPGYDTVRDALGDHPANDFAADPELLGTIDAANRSDVVLGALQSQGDGSYRLWAVVDNLTRGAALNAVAILEAVRHPSRAN